MLQYIWLLPLFPFLGFVLLALFSKYFSKTMVAAIGIGSVALSALVALIAGFEFFQLNSSQQTYSIILWDWLSVGNFTPTISFFIDPLTLVFIFVITGVGLLIHIYSAEYMAHEEGYSRFFAYMNLFVGSMLTLVMADNLLLLYLGWEGVGLCSYLLIGFFYKDPANNYAARKAFIVTRVGDTAMLIGLLFIIHVFGTVHIPSITQQANDVIGFQSTLATTIALLFLGGAVGKSAQLPLQVWLPDAMAGPSPVSALIHAATMVTAGVYLIARMHAIFILSPLAMTVVATVGALTLLIAASSALYQFDLKRVLAYSTISQIGYMFLALGVGAWSAAIFHFMIHAFFKALLFLAAGAVILSLHHEQNMFKMGGLYKKMPVIFWTFLIGSASLAALPIFTAGFYSKDSIIWYSFASNTGNFYLWMAAIVGAFLTSIYTFRMVFITFFGEEKTHIHYRPGKLIMVPLIILAILTTIGGFIEIPENFGHIQFFSAFLSSALPAITLKTNVPHEIWFQLISAFVALGGVYVAYVLYLKKQPITYNQHKLQHFLLHGWQFDKIYDILFVRPFVAIANYFKDDAINEIFDIAGLYLKKCGTAFSITINSRINWYLVSIVVGVIIMLAVMIIK